MKVFMLGWEFPPYISGGLGTACYGLTKALSSLDVKVTFVLPRMIDGRYSGHVNLLSDDSLSGDLLSGDSLSGDSLSGDSLSSSVSFEIDKLKNIKFRAINSPLLSPYSTSEVYQQKYQESLKQKRAINSNCQFGDFGQGLDYGGDMYAEVRRYALIAGQLAKKESFDVIHAHDWMTFPAGIAVAAISGKALVVHVHSTEFDRSGENVNQMVYDIEREGMHAADTIIAVSGYTRNIIINRYGVSGEKVEVVHNGVDRDGNGSNSGWALSQAGIEKDEKIVLFLGRITMQKGPEYFLEAARKVLEIMDNVKFVMAGSGDMMHRTIEMAAELGIGSKVLFTGFLHGDEVRRIYQMADLFVMPSVSEPFGIVPLEALNNDVPVIISKQSGVSEVLKHVLKVDFWDIDEIANKIIAVLKYPPLKITLQNHGNFEVRKLRWLGSAEKCVKIYREMLTKAAIGV